MLDQNTWDELDDKIITMLEAKSTPKAYWHCVEQISKEIGEDPWAIYKALHNDTRMPEVIQTDFGGMEWFTTRKKYDEYATWWRKFVAALAGRY